MDSTAGQPSRALMVLALGWGWGGRVGGQGDVCEVLVLVLRVARTNSLECLGVQLTGRRNRVSLVLVVPGCLWAVLEVWLGQTDGILMLADTESQLMRLI